MALALLGGGRWQARKLQSALPKFKELPKATELRRYGGVGFNFLVESAMTAQPATQRFSSGWWVA